MTQKGSRPYQCWGFMDLVPPVMVSWIWTLHQQCIECRLLIHKINTTGPQEKALEPKWIPSGRVLYPSRVYLRSPNNGSQKASSPSCAEERRPKSDARWSPISNTWWKADGIQERLNRPVSHMYHRPGSYTRTHCRGG